MKRDCPSSTCHKPCVIKYTPNSVSLNDQFKKYTALATSGSLTIGWETLLHYNTILVEIVGTDQEQVFNLNIGGLSSQKDQYIKCYKEKNCIHTIPTGYIYAEIIVKLVGNVTVNVYQYSNPLNLLITQSNDFYNPLPVPTPTDLQYHFHVFYTL